MDEYMKSVDQRFKSLEEQMLAMNQRLTQSIQSLSAEFQKWKSASTEANPAITDHSVFDDGAGEAYSYDDFQSSVRKHSDDDDPKHDFNDYDSDPAPADSKSASELGKGATMEEQFKFMNHKSDVVFYEVQNDAPEVFDEIPKKNSVVLLEVKKFGSSPEWRDGCTVDDCVHDTYKIDLERKYLAYDSRIVLTFGAFPRVKLKINVLFEDIALIRSNGICSSDHANEKSFRGFAIDFLKEGDLNLSKQMHSNACQFGEVFAKANAASAEKFDGDELSDSDKYGCVLQRIRKWCGIVLKSSALLTIWIYVIPVLIGLFFELLGFVLKLWLSIEEGEEAEEDLERFKNEEILDACKGHLVRKFIKQCWWNCGGSTQCEGFEKLIAETPEGGVIFLENERFYKEEEKNNPEFAKRLTCLADLYVNDAFGTAHRAQVSTKGVEYYLKPAVTFYKAQGITAGSSLVEEDKLDLATSLMEKIKSKGVDLMLLSDVVMADKFAVDANSKTVPSSSIPDWIWCFKLEVRLSFRLCLSFRAEGKL